MSEHGRVEGKAALVTGASSGLGRATAIALARAGADVALAARSKDELEGAKGEISELGRRALTLPLDLASETDTAEAVGRTFEAFGRIDILINAAGTDAPGTVEELSVEGWDRTLDVNLRRPSCSPRRPSRICVRRAVVRLSTSPLWRGRRVGRTPRPTVLPSSVLRASPKPSPTKGRNTA